MKVFKHYVAALLLLLAGQGLQAQQAARTTSRQQMVLDSIKQRYLDMGIPEEWAARRAQTIYNEQYAVQLRREGANKRWSGSTLVPQPAVPGSIWIDRGDDAGTTFSDYHAFTPEEFVKKVFVKDADKLGPLIDQVIKDVTFEGEGWDATTKTWTSDDRTLLYFDHGDTTTMVPDHTGTPNVHKRFGINNGFLLATGPALDAEGPNSSSSGINSTVGILGTLDADLQSTIPQPLGTQTILTFKFKPFVDSVSFKYVFASTEFKNYSNSSFNDAFGFFVSGPGLEDEWGNTGATINIARYPDGTPIAVNSSNWGYRGDNNYSGYDPLGLTPVSVAPSWPIPPALASPNTLAVRPEYHVPVYQSGHTVQGGVTTYVDCDTTLMEFDGHSVVLTARVKLKRGEWYTMKLAIGNASDQALGSGAFLAAGSFDLGAPESKIPTPYAKTAFDSTALQNMYCNCDNYIQLKFPTAAVAGDTLVIWSEGEGADAVMDPNTENFFNIPQEYPMEVGAESMTIRFRVAEKVIREKNGAKVMFLSKFKYGAQTDTSDVLDLYDQARLQKSYIRPNRTYAGRLNIDITNGSPLMQRSVDGGVTWETARLADGSVRPFTPVQIDNLSSEEGSFVIYREPNTCRPWDTIYINRAEGPIIVQRTVIMPAIAGAVSSLAPGEHRVSSRNDLVFTLTPTEENVGKELKVTTSRTSNPDSEGVSVVKNPDGSYTVTIHRVQEAIEVFVNFVTASETIGTSRVWAGNNGTLYIHPDRNGTARVFAISGAQVQAVAVTAGSTAALQLPAGFYIVALDGGYTTKVIVR